VETLASNNPMAIAVLANLYVNQTRTELEKRAEYKTKLFELAKLKGYDREKTKRLLTFVLYLMQLPEELEAEMKSFFNKNKKSSTMSVIPQIKSKKRAKILENEKFIEDLTYHFAYGKSYDEIYDILYDKALGDAGKAVQAELLAAEQAKVMAAEQAKVMAAEQAKVMAAAEQIEQSIATMFQKTGWSAEKIADISGFALDLVQKVVDKIK
jgi:hypothetical protein